MTRGSGIIDFTDGSTVLSHGGPSHISGEHQTTSGHFHISIWTPFCSIPLAGRDGSLAQSTLDEARPARYGRDYFGHVRIEGEIRMFDWKNLAGWNRAIKTLLFSPALRNGNRAIKTLLFPPPALSLTKTLLFLPPPFETDLDLRLARSTFNKT